MKEKIINALKTKYANLGLGTKAFDGVAEWLVASKTIENEDGISTTIEGEMVKNLLKAFQSESDSLRTARQKAEKDLEDYKKAHPSKDTSNEGDDPTKTLVESLVARLEATEAKLAASEKESKVKAMASEVDRILVKNGATNDYIRRNVLKALEIKDGDTAEALASTLKESYDKEFKEAFGDGVLPPKGSPHVEGYKKGDYSAFAASLKADGILPNEGK